MRCASLCVCVLLAAFASRVCGAERGPTAVLSACIERTVQGKLDEAEPLMKESLAIDKKAFGSEHPNVARGINHLAQLYQDQASSAL